VLVEDTVRAFGPFNGIAYEWHNGFFEGETSRGRFRLIYLLIAPVDPGLGNGTVVFEPPHGSQAAVGRDVTLGRELLFGNGFSYAGVGWSNVGRSLYNPAEVGMLLAGEPVVAQLGRSPAVIADVEILHQFAQALTTDSTAVRILGPIERKYAYGISQTAMAMLELRRHVAAEGGEDPFDLTLVHSAYWGAPERGLDLLGGAFEPVEPSGRVMFVQAEGDLIMSDAEQIRRAAALPSYRVYEVAGASHLPSEDNPLDHPAVARAMLMAGDAWVRSGVAPPPSLTIEEAPAGQVDALSGARSGIARDADLNARGGVRLPELATGRARLVASDPATVPRGFLPLLGFLTGSVVDLACEPPVDLPGTGPRFRDDAQYQQAVDRVLAELEEGRFLLQADVAAFRARAAQWTLPRCAP
jgi:hypothetical protein